MNVRRAEPTPSDIDLVAPLFDAYRQFYGLMSDLALSRTFVAERLERNESVIFVATEEQVAVPQVESLTLDSSVDKGRAQSGSERALG